MDQNRHAEPHTVYRLLGQHDRLLYIGCTINLDNRLGQHRNKPWRPEVVRVVSDVYPDRATAHEAERNAIRAECPRYNQTSMNPGAFGEGTYDREVKIRNCTVLVGMEHDTGRIKAAFIPHGAKGYDLHLAVKRIAKAAATVARKYPQHGLGVDFAAHKSG
jgi:predicted GIY-YIG superfamily endonuclease